MKAERQVKKDEGRRSKSLPARETWTTIHLAWALALIGVLLAFSVPFRQPETSPASHALAGDADKSR